MFGEDRKLDVTGELKLELFNATSMPKQFKNAPGFSWSDGTPTKIGVDVTTGIFVANPNGFSMTVGADTRARAGPTLYVGAFRSPVTMQIQSSGLKEPVRLRVPRTTSSNNDVAVEIEFEGDVSVTWKQDAGQDTGNVTFQAAKLEKLAGSPLSGVTLLVGDIKVSRV